MKHLIQQPSNDLKFKLLLQFITEKTHFLKIIVLISPIAEHYGTVNYRDVR